MQNPTFRETANGNDAKNIVGYLQVRSMHRRRVCARPDEAIEDVSLLTADN